MSTTLCRQEWIRAETKYVWVWGVSHEVHRWPILNRQTFQALKSAYQWSKLISSTARKCLKCLTIQYLCTDGVSSSRDHQRLIMNVHLLAQVLIWGQFRTRKSYIQCSKITKPYILNYLYPIIILFKMHMLNQSNIRA